MGLDHAPTGSTLFVAVYWVTYAASTAFLTAALLLVPYYLLPLIRLWRLRRRWLPRRHRAVVHRLPARHK